MNSVFKKKSVAKSEEENLLEKAMTQKRMFWPICHNGRKSDCSMLNAMHTNYNIEIHCTKTCPSQCATGQQYVHFVSAQAIIWQRNVPHRYYAKSHRLDQHSSFLRMLMTVRMYYSPSVKWTSRTSMG